jgi:hypothetical protein
MKILVISAAISASLLGVASAAGQGAVEVRLADTKYRFIDVSFARKNGVVFDGFYVGVPRSNELNIGGGYALKRGALTLTPLLYAVIGKEDGQRGVKGALLTAFETGDWKFLSFIGAYIRASGSVDAYQVLDTADLTRTLTTRWELGVQGGFFRTGGAWNTQVGPLLKFNDSRGAWAVSYRFGSEKELRVARVLGVLVNESEPNVPPFVTATETAQNTTASSLACYSSHLRWDRRPAADALADAWLT